MAYVKEDPAADTSMVTRHHSTPHPHRAGGQAAAAGKQQGLTETRKQTASSGGETPQTFLQLWDHTMPGGTSTSSAMPVKRTITSRSNSHSRV